MCTSKLLPASFLRYTVRPFTFFFCSRMVQNKWRMQCTVIIYILLSLHRSQHYKVSIVFCLLTPDLPRQQWSLLNLFARNRDIAVPGEGNGDLQTLICVLVARPRRCPTSSNPVPWQNWMAAHLGYTLRMKMLFRGWPFMVHDTHTRRRRLPSFRRHLKTHYFQSAYPNP